MRVDVVDSHLRRRSSSAAKQADTDFRISFDRFSSPVRSFELCDPALISRRGSRRLAGIDLPLLEPVRQRLRMHIEVRPDLVEPTVLTSTFSTPIGDQPRVCQEFRVSGVI